MHVFVRAESKVDFHPLVVRREAPSEAGGEELLLVGRKGSADYLDVSRAGVEIIRLLEKGKTIAQAERMARDDLHVDYDVKSFVMMLAREHLVRAVDGKTLAREQSEDFIEVSSKLPFTRKNVAPLFSYAALAIYAIILLEGAILIALDFNNFISYENFIFSDSLSVFLIVSFIASWVLVALHELGHYLAALHYGAKPKFGLTARLQYLVAFTDVSDLYLVDKTKRAIVFLSGMLVDGLVLSLAVGAVWAHNYGVFLLPLWLFRFLRFVILAQFFGLIWQTMIFLRTDFYYLFENVLGIEGLHDKSIRALKTSFSELMHWQVRLALRTEIRKRIVAFYNLLLVFGVLANVGLFLLYELPIALTLINESLFKLVAAVTSVNWSATIDPIVFLTIYGFNFILLFVGFYKSHEYSWKGVKNLLVYARSLVYPVYALTYKNVLKQFIRGEKKLLVKGKGKGKR